MKRAMRWIAAGLLAMAVLTMVLADIVLAAPAAEFAAISRAELSSGAMLPPDANEG